nr:nonstructural protein 1 [Psittaciform chaphamaparvovirus 6]
MSRQMESSGTSFRKYLWMGRCGTGVDLQFPQTTSLLIQKDLVTAPEPVLQQHFKMLDMKEHQCCVLQISDVSGQPVIDPLIYAVFLNDLTTISYWACTGEYNKDGIFHVHCLLKTSARSDSVRRSMFSTWQRLNTRETFTNYFGQDGTVDCLKLQRCYRPSSILCYMMKNPQWILSNDEKMLQTLHDIDVWKLSERFKPKDKTETSPEMNQMTKEIVDAIVMHNCKTIDDLFRCASDMMSKYLHRPGLTGIVNNCLGFVKATGGGWALQLYAEYEPKAEPIHRILLHQDIFPSEFDYIMYRWLTKQDPKRNTICIKGPSNTGKSAFIAGMKQCIPWGEVVNTNTFAFEGLLDCTIGIWEEPLCSAELAEKAKQVLEGMTCSIPIKFKKPQMLNRTPIFITTNHDIWRWCSAEEDAFKNRMWIFTFNYPIQNTAYCCRACELSCECGYCQRSRSGTPAISVSGLSAMSPRDESISAREQGDSGTDTSTIVRSGSMSDPGEGTSRSDYRTPSSSSISTTQCSTHTSGHTISTSTTTIRHFLDEQSKSRSKHSSIGGYSSGSESSKHVESNVSSGDDGDDSSRNGSTRGRQQLHKRKSRRARTNIRKRSSTTAMGLLEKTETGEETVQLPTKQRRMGRSVGTIDDITKSPFRIPSKQDWQSYLSWLLQKYGN